MSDVLVRDIRAALEQVRADILQSLDTLLRPYERMLKNDPGSVSVTPDKIVVREAKSRIGPLAERVLAAGGFSAPLFEVEKHEGIVDQLVTEYRAELPLTRVWFVKLGPVRADALAAIDAALAETTGYEELGGKSEAPATPPKAGLSKDVLEPQDLLGELDIKLPAIRKRVRLGHLGPWAKQGGRWMILRKDFEAWLTDAAVLIEAGRSKAAAEQRADVLRLVGRRKPRRGGGGAKGGSTTS